MTHRKAHSYSESEGRVPFSWEEKAGVPKCIPHQSYAKTKTEISTTNTIQQPLKKSSSSHFHSPVNMMMSCRNDKKISPPPRMARPPSRSSSMRSLWGQRHDDPFAAAIKECTKNIASSGVSRGSKKLYDGSKERSQKIIFSCKKSCDVKENTLVRLVDLPPLPRNRNKGQAR